MGWPKKNEECRLYFEKACKSYMIVIVEQGKNYNGHYNIVANIQESSNPCLASGSCSVMYIRNFCKRVQWSDMPAVWQKAFQNIMKNNDWDKTNPKDIRGFWKI